MITNGRRRIAGRLIRISFCAVGFMCYLSLLPYSHGAREPYPSNATVATGGPSHQGRIIDRGEPSAAAVPMATLDTLMSTSLVMPMAGPTVTATKAVDVHTHAHLGDTLTYTVVITNNGPGSATGVNFLDTIDANTTLVAN